MLWDMKTASGMIFVSLFMGASVTFANVSKTYKTEKVEVVWEELLQRQDVIWGFDFLPDGKVLLTERSGAMLSFDPATGKIHNIKGVPKVWAQGQGGLLDVKVHPEFSKNALVIFAYSEPLGKGATTSVARAKLLGHELKELRRIFQAKAGGDEDIHFGGRLEFESAKTFFLSVGDRNERKKAQDLGLFHNGKILRLDMDGKAPADNPFVGDKAALPEIWSLGHRNPQGLARDADTGTLWETEFGPRGGDELNRIEKGKNYGWPFFTYGREYWGPKIGETATKPGYVEAITYWVPSISPSGLALYKGDKFPAWKGDLFLASLGSTHLRRLKLENQKDGTKVVEQEVLLKDMAVRFRNVRQGLDGNLYISTDDGKFGRLRPAVPPAAH